HSHKEAGPTSSVPATTTSSDQLTTTKHTYLCNRCGRVFDEYNIRPDCPDCHVMLTSREIVVPARSRSIVDVCSGGGGPWLDLSQKLRGGTAVYRICLTDKFPNLAAFENVKSASAKGIDFYRSSVDAAKVPVELDGFRTMFSSFHHFPPAQARAILQNAVDARQGIGIFEITSRTASAVGMMFLWFLTPFAFTPSIRPFRWSRLLYTYVLWRWGLKLAERGGKNAKKRAVIAVARKLAVLLHKLWVSGEVYESL